MGNMARDRCCARRSLMFLAIILAFDLIVVASAKLTDVSHFRYETHLADELADVDDDLEFQLRSNPSSLRTLDRRRRLAPESAPVTPTTQQQPPPAPKSTVGQDTQPVISTKSSTSVNVSYTTQDQNNTSTGAPAVDALMGSGNGTTNTSITAAPGSSDVVVSVPIVPNANKTVDDSANGTAGVVTVSTTEKSKAYVLTDSTKKPDLVSMPGETNFDGFETGFEDKLPAEVTNKTLQEKNITKQETDTHQYYNSTFSIDETNGRKYWIDLDNNPETQVNSLLSKSHRRAATIKLKFDFPFYGHKVRNITIATGGFLYTGEYVHSWLAATQYIAPLMANFDTTLSDKSFVKYLDNGTAFTVEWQNVHLQDKPDAGAFTFQVTLKQNGDIIFVYSKIPVLVENIEDKEHPVKIGLSDAYMMDRTVYFARRKTIYEYHRVNFNRQDIKNWTVIYLKALPTCLQMENCNDCLTKIKEFDCKWCPELQKCSTGTFRFRQDWLQKGCDMRNIKEEAKCPARPPILEHDDSRAANFHVDDAPEMTKYSPNMSVGQASSSVIDHPSDNMSMGVSGILGILLVVSLVVGLGAWAAYAYRNPHSTSGQMLIRYRPSQWSWRRGEARYTAATIHM